MTLGSMNTTSIAEQLLLTACPTIQYRIRKEILGDSPFHAGMCDLQSKILEDESVRKVTACQAPDGWLSWNFHGYGSMESGIRLLCEKGSDINQPVLKSALLALEQGGDRLERGLGRAGKILDDLGFGGSETIRASLYAQAGMEEQPFVKKEIQPALDAFRFAAKVHSLEEIYERDKTRLIFRKGIRWPGIYQLRLLAWAQNWRVPENCKMMGESIQNLVRLSPIPDIYVRYKSQVIAPASFCMHYFAPEMNVLSDCQWMQWFHRMELLSRLGVVQRIAELKQQSQILKDLLLENHGLFTKKLNHPYFQKWGAYTGLAVERDWRSIQRRVNDLTFRSLLILNYSGQ